jgi:hypothetical protein
VREGGARLRCVSASRECPVSDVRDYAVSADFSPERCAAFSQPKRSCGGIVFSAAGFVVS